MQTVFLAHSFQDADRELVDSVDRLLASHALLAITGKSVGGGPLTPEIKERIDKSDALIAILSRRDELATGGWTTSDWVRDELAHARAKDKPTMAVIEQGVKTGGAYGENEYIVLDRQNPLEAFLRLSETLREWQDRQGRLVRIRLQPDEAAELAADDGAGVRCRYRLMDDQGVASGWSEGTVYEHAGGVLLYVKGAHERQNVQVSIEIEGQGAVWRSPFEPQLMQVTLKAKGAGQ